MLGLGIANSGRNGPLTTAPASRVLGTSIRATGSCARMAVRDPPVTVAELLAGAD